jgi:flagellar motor component MotA
MNTPRVAPMSSDPSELVDDLCRLAEAMRTDGAQAIAAAAREPAGDDFHAALDLAAGGASAEEILCQIESRIFALTMIGEGMTGILSGEEPRLLRARLAAMLGDEGRARLLWRRGPPTGAESPAA